MTDGLQPGDWRLPNARQSNTLIDYGRYIPALPVGHPFSGVQKVHYWSSTSIPRLSQYDDGHAWGQHFGGGYAGLSLKTEAYYVWPVRGGR